MLHEVYAPLDVAAVAWSRQKKTAFVRLVCDMRDGAQLPGVVLLYGPTGSAKLSSVVAMLHEQIDANGNPTHVEVRHSCETSPQEYYAFLMETFAERRGSGSEGTVARIVKFYGDPLWSNLHALTARFLDQYKSHLHGKDVTDRGDSAERLMLLRRNLLFFIITTHDTHSDKVALGKSLPSRVLTHSVLQQFHCTPLTTRNITARVKQILKLEQQPKQQSQNSRTAKISLSDEYVELLCEHSHGDIRHALLQVQWHTLSDRDTSCAPRLKAQRKRQRNMLDLLDDEHFSEPQDSNSLPIPTDDCDASPFRDEYLDVAHATARILTQKYAISSVTAELNVEPGKLLGYLANNMHAYFHTAQMDEFAACASAASAADALRAVSDSRAHMWRNGRVLHTTRLTADDDNEGDGAIGLDVMALVIFSHAYVAHHKEVCIPKGFVAQKPPPYVGFAYPRLRDSSPRASSPALPGRDSPPGRGQTAALFSSEAEWGRDFLRRLELQMPPALEADVLRESLPALVDRCGSLEAALLEYAPYARWIVLDRPPPHEAHERATDSRSYPEPPLLSQSQRSGVTPGPKKTLFSLVGASQTRAHQLARPKRMCSELRYRILCRGVEGRPSVREGHFTLADTEIETEGCGVTELPLIPDGEDIEDFSD